MSDPLGQPNSEIYAQVLKAQINDANAYLENTQLCADMGIDINALKQERDEAQAQLNQLTKE